MPELKGSMREFLEALDWKIRIEWFGNHGIHRLDESRHVRIALSESNGRSISTHETYVSVKATVFHKERGDLSTELFPFQDYLRERGDARIDQPNMSYKIIAHCGWKWYIAVPKTTRHLCQAVEDWIDNWR